MACDLIVMLTHNDVTVADAGEMFEVLKHLPVQHWGFKDVGLPPEQVKEVVGRMKAAGKTTYLEVVTLTEAEGMAGAQLAVEAGFDVLMGTVYYDSIGDFLRDKPIRYYPFPGRVHGHPSILDGTIDEIVAHACALKDKGAAGLDLLTYRYTGDAPALLKAVVLAAGIPVVSAGSIASIPRIAEVQAAGAAAFTIGTAFFERRFAPNGSFADNVQMVCDWLEANGRVTPAA